MSAVCGISELMDSSISVQKNLSKLSLVHKDTLVDEISFLALADERKELQISVANGKNLYFLKNSLYFYTGIQTMATWNHQGYTAFWHPFKGMVLLHYPHLCFILSSCSFSPKKHLMSAHYTSWVYIGKTTELSVLKELASLQQEEIRQTRLF